MEYGRTVHTEAVRNFVYVNNICSGVPHYVQKLIYIFVNNGQCYVNFSLLQT